MAYADTQAREYSSWLSIQFVLRERALQEAHMQARAAWAGHADAVHGSAAVMPPSADPVIDFMQQCEDFMQQEMERAAHADQTSPGAEGPAADVPPSADPVMDELQQYEDLIHQQMERAAHADQSSPDGEELQQGGRHGRVGSDMMARISVCPQRPRRHAFEKRLDGAERLAASHLRFV